MRSRFLHIRKTVFGYEKLLNGMPDDKIIFYATEACLQLHIAEAGEHL